MRRKHGEWSDRANKKRHHSGNQTNREINNHHSFLQINLEKTSSLL